MTAPPYSDWLALRRVSRSPYFSGGKEDIAFDQGRHGKVDAPPFAPNVEALFTQSNGRVLLGHAANGMLRFVALPTQVYPAPTGTRELGLGVGMYHHFDVAMYAGDLNYRLVIEGRDDPITISSPTDPLSGLTVTSFYGDDFLPVTIADAEGLEITLVSVAPVADDPTSAPLSPAPLPGPAGVLYAIQLRNTGHEEVRGRLILKAQDRLVGHYEDLRSGRELSASPHVSERQGTLIVTQPYGAVGIHLHEGAWTSYTAPFEAEVSFELIAGAERVFETHVVVGSTYADIIPTIYELHRRPALDWLNLTADFWLGRLGNLCVGIEGADNQARLSRDMYIRSLFDNFNCLQTDGHGDLLAHWQGAPSHGYGTIWGIDVEPTAVSIAHLCPEMTWAALRFFMGRSRVPKGEPDHSLQILVAPIVIARQWLQVTGDAARFEREAGVMEALTGIADDLLALRHPGEPLYPSRFASDGAVGRRFDYGTNAKVWYAFDSMTVLAEHLGDADAAVRYRESAEALGASIEQHMIAVGPFGPQITGGTNLDEDPGTFYLPEDVLYYDGEDTSTMLAPIYGLVGFDDEAWVNYHRFARSMWCPNFDPEFGALRWSPRGFAGGALDGTAYFSRLSGSVTPEEMLEAHRLLADIATDPVTGSVFWWPHGLPYTRSLTRCSQGQGAWAWQYLAQWLGVEIDAPRRTLTLAPRGLLTSAEWEGFSAGALTFDIAWRENPAPADRATGSGDDGGSSYAEVRNANSEPWTVKVGFRLPGAGAAGPLTWQSRELAPGEVGVFVHHSERSGPTPSWTDRRIAALEAECSGDRDLMVRRFGPAHLWGHWELASLWEPEAMPLTLRFVIQKASEGAWRAMTVRLGCPPGWQAAARSPQQWTRPEAWRDEAILCLEAPGDAVRVVAPFWVRGPDDLTLDLDWHEAPSVPFHATTQPGPGIRLYASGINEPHAVTFEVIVRVDFVQGVPGEYRLAIPVSILPS